jgi:hypothetical protein
MEFDTFWEVLVDLGSVAGFIPLNQHPGIVRFNVDDSWKLSMNGHTETIEQVPPFSVYVEFNGWPAGIIDPSGGCIAAGQLANLDTLLTAMRLKLGQLRKESQ